MSKKGSIILTLSTGCMLSGPMSAECKLENANPSETSIFYVVIDFFFPMVPSPEEHQCSVGNFKEQSRAVLASCTAHKKAGRYLCVWGGRAGHIQ